METAHSEKIWAGDKVFNGKKLSQIFEAEIPNDKIAWYVDYFTEDAAQYNVRYLAEDNGQSIPLTNEDKTNRDANNPEETVWTSADVAEWFGKGRPQHTLLFIFAHESDEIFGIHCEPHRVFPFGSRSLTLPAANLWDEYVSDGIYGPIKSCLHAKSANLVAIVCDSNFVTLEQWGLAQDYVLTLAAILDDK